MSVIYEGLVGLVHWPNRVSMRTRLPHHFEAFGESVAVVIDCFIIDCFEVFTERPSNLKTRAQTFSIANITVHFST